MTRTISSLLIALAVAFAVPLSGCTKPAAPVAPKDNHGDDHAHDAPHGGHIIELGGDEFHAELVDDHDKHTVTIYVLDSEAKNAVPIDAKEVTLNLVVASKPAQFTLAAMPDKGDPEGKSSRFHTIDEALCDALDAKDTKGRLNITINDKSYSGNIAGHEH